MDDLYIHGYRLVLGCFACPEQYDVFDPKGNLIAYLRLRHGKFTVECPDVNGETVYTAYPRGDGIFNAEERLFFLNKAIEAIQKYKFEKLHEKLQDFFK